MFGLIATLFFVLALPLALAFSNFRWFVQEPTNYVELQSRHGVAAATGLPQTELAAIDRGLVRYFQSDRQSLQSSLTEEGVAHSPFSDRDAAHLVDVHDLISGTLTLQWLAAGYCGLFLLVNLVQHSWRRLGRAIVAGSTLTIGLLGLLGLLSALDWDALFLKFHFVSFSNDLWRLDPSRDALIRLYPPGFFFDATVRLVEMSIGEALLLATLAFLSLRNRKATKAIRV